MKRRLVLLRHAKAERGSTTDHERPLTARGRADAIAAGRCLAESKLAPDLTICSTATRAKETWVLAATELEDGIETTYERAVYHADLEDLVALLRETPDDVQTLLLVGHNPGLHYLVQTLAGSGPEHLLREAREHLATSGIAALEFDVPWSELDPGAGRLFEYVVARG
ncbi:SixA phosphatase family protein [Sporichthya polymorpha]|uniref:SixA phosphatase family protein n=1 Tax=Sporichthya polymorpha TaxID=35751 RepID=UPI000377DAA6|nr:histidine phosphatase family protein [Sporichthya polymorpha]